MKKKIVSCLVTLICMLNSMAVFANYGDNCTDFLGRYYDVFNYDFEDLLQTPQWDNMITDISGTSVLKVGEKIDFLSGTSGFAGKTYFSFELMADTLKSFDFSINTPDMFNVHLLPIDNDSMKLGVNSDDVCDLLCGQWSKYEFFIDTFSKFIKIIITTPTGDVIQKEFAIENVDIISALTVSAEGAVYIDNVRMSRKIKSFDDSIVITGDGKYVAAFSENLKSDILYLAQYRDGNLVDYSVSCSSINAPYSETYLYADIKNGDIFKAFLWNEDLIPRKINSVLKSSDIKVTEISASGNISANSVKLGDKVDFDISFLDGYTGNYKVIVYSENAQEVQLDGKVGTGVSYTPSISGKCTAFLYSEKYGRAALAGKCEFLVADVMPENTAFMFPADKNYYVCNGERISYDSTGYIPLMLGGHIYMSADRIRKLTGIEIEGETVKYLGNKLAVIGDGKFSADMKYGLYSFGDICSLLGFRSEMQDDVLCIVRGNAVDIFDYRDLLFDFVTTSKSTSYFDWSTQQHSGGKYSSATGIYTAKAVQSNYAGFPFSVTKNKLDGSLYEVSFEVEYSDDSKNIMPWVGMYTTKNGSFANLYTGLNTGEGEIGKWTKVRSYFTKRTLDNDAFDTVSAFYVGVKRKEDAVSQGTLMFRNVRVREVSVSSDSTECEIICQKYASWHTLGDTVCYRAKDSKFSGFESISGVVCNSDNEQVYEKTISANNFINYGWNWVPDRLGYYEAEFYGIRSDGSKSLLVSTYSENYSESYAVYTLPRRSFAVVRGNPKPMSERSDLLMLSDDAMGEDSLKLADMVGFSGIRIHGVPWGDTADKSGFHKGRGSFDWTATDKQINNVKKYGFKNVIANVFATPTWAVSRNDVTSGVGYTLVGLWYKNCYPPDDMNVAAEGYGAYAERYKDVLDGIEIWNEPTYGNTAFWYQGNKSNQDMEQDFVNLTVTASNAIRKNAPGVKVYSAGFNQSDQFFESLLNYDGYADSFDGVTCHGRYSDPEVYKNILTDKNISGKEVLNSEGYFYAYYDVGVPKNYKENNMVFYAQYLKHIKMGISKITHFSLFDNTLDERRVYTKGWNCAGLFRDYPYIEPHQGAVAAFNLFNSFGKDITYKDEYSFSNGIRAVSVNTDGKINIYFWNVNNMPYYLADELADCVGSNSRVIDFEGNESFKDERFGEMRMYCIENADAKASEKLVSAQNEVLNSDYIAPYYTCDDGKGSGESYTSLKGYYTKGALFDKTTFEDTDSTLVCYHSDNAEWISVDNNKQDISAKYALSFDSDGMYVKVIVNDNEYVNHAGSVNTMANHDCVRFAVDCNGRWQNSERAEFFAGCAGIRPLLYKYHAADKNEALVVNWNPSGTNLGNKYLRIERSDTDMTTVYKVFVPYSELYPLNLATESPEIKFALSVTDRDGVGTKGYLSFGMGLSDDDSPNVWKYMDLKLKEYEALNGYYTKGALFDKVNFDDTNIVPVYNSDNAEWIAVDNHKQDISAKYALSFDSDGMYVKVIVNDNEYVNHAGSVNTMVNHDCVRFSVDCCGSCKNSERAEFFAGCAEIRPLLYKYHAADKNEALVENWSPSGTNLGNKYLRIERSDTDKTTVYKVFVPYSELHPLNLATESPEIRFALSVTDRDGVGTKGCLSFGMGLSDDDSPKICKYMKLNTKE